MSFLGFCFIQIFTRLFIYSQIPDLSYTACRLAGHCTPGLFMLKRFLAFLLSALKHKKHTDSSLNIKSCHILVQSCDSDRFLHTFVLALPFLFSWLGLPRGKQDPECSFITTCLNLSEVYLPHLWMHLNILNNKSNNKVCNKSIINNNNNPILF